jgi:four helix bundle protein
VSANGRLDLRERSFAFSVAIVRLCQELDRTPGVSRRLSGQLFDAGTSIAANVREGQAGQSRADFVSKFGIALKEANETEYWLQLLSAAALAPAAEIESLRTEVGCLARIIGRSIITARKNDPKRRVMT